MGARYLDGDPLANAERYLAGVLEGREPHDPMRRGHLADLEVALAELRVGIAERAAPLIAFREGLTEALSAHGVPATASWRDAIDWLAEHGGRS